MRLAVRDWMNDLVVYIDPDSPVVDALALMRRRYCNSLIVNKTEGSPHYGIITSTDICDKIVAQGQDPAIAKVSELMTAPVIGVPPEMTIQECAALMKSHHIHHLPVIEESGKVIGMISATDFLVVAEAMGRPGERKLS